MNVYFVDTAFLLALEVEEDQYHHQANEIWNEVAKTSFHFLTSSYVFDETITFLNDRNYHQKAIEVGEDLLLSPHVELVHVDYDLFFEAWKLFQERNDKRYSLTDCVSFVLMRSRAVSTALTFDRHFEQEGFVIYKSE